VIDPKRLGRRWRHSTRRSGPCPRSNRCI
jgi:hypothetical protein